MKTIQIQNGLVLICGPSSSGKTTLAKKLYNTAPYAEKCLISHDEMLKDFLRQNGFKDDVFYTGLKGGNEEQFKLCVLKVLCAALQKREFVIYESVYCNTNHLTQLIASFPVLGLDRPLTLIKMWLPMNLNLYFATKRPEERAFRPDALVSQRGGFSRVVESNFYASQAEWIREYTVNDPRQLNIEFKKPKELTKELMAAYETRERMKETMPHLVQAAMKI